MKPDITIHHNPQAQRFEAQLGDGTALCSYRRQADVLVLHHTAVPPALQAQGIAAVLVQAALDWARSEGLRVDPQCSYVASFMRRHPHTQDLLA